MRELHYVNDVLLVSDEICEAVFAYAAALARAVSADVIQIPILWRGKRAYSNIVLGTASQLFCTPSDLDDEGVDVNDEALVLKLRTKTRLLGTSCASPATADAREYQLAAGDSEYFAGL